jgi:hypothetical protein
LEVGILRCYVPGGMPEMATCAQHTTVAVNYAEDMMRIKEAICCWERTLPKGRLFQVMGISPVGPSANCIQTTGAILVHVPRCC